MLEPVGTKSRPAQHFAGSDMIGTGATRDLCKSLLTSAQHQSVLGQNISARYVGIFYWTATKMAVRCEGRREVSADAGVRGEHCRLIRSCPGPVLAAVRLSERTIISLQHNMFFSLQFLHSAPRR